jgi:hypothetical protein
MALVRSINFFKAIFLACAFGSNCSYLMSLFSGTGIYAGYILAIGGCESFFF